ncbi:HAD-IIB family hydrolase [Mycoplasmopsis agalactiae]|uniref:HAD-IIB family hydrolase n=1 Tax=Mycoplasmopsis agalactiae TaxID=2110 RepID=UPI001F8F7810|nr:HAD-IIB family hydrolase [Mycoplasmopsis agalactiae]MCE6115281.1 HAD-IIB family hydrolase [Mycoplasmopsis agalactiae]
MKKKIFSYDLDGTLLMSNNKVHPVTKKAFHDVHKKGGINILNTGRGLLKVLPLLDEFDGIDYFICSNGALIYDVKNKKHIVVGRLESDVFEKMFEYAYKNNLIISFDTADFTATYVNKDADGNFPEWIMKQDIMDFAHIKFSDYETMSKVASDSDSIITQVAIRNPNEIAIETTKYFSNLYKDKYSVYLTNRIYTDVNPLGISKWNGLKEFMKIYNLHDCTIYAFGDSSNDVEILQNAHYGFAMENATDDAKAVATEIIGHYNSGAIGIKLEEIIKSS